MNLKARAIAKWVSISPRKLRLVANTVRGKTVRKAVDELHFSVKKASEPVEKTIRSALANLLLMEDAAKVDPDNVVIETIYVNEGPTQKRFRPRAMGRASRIRKRTSHLTVIVVAK